MINTFLIISEYNKKVTLLYFGGIFIMLEISAKTVSKLLRKIISGENFQELSSSESEIFSVLNEQIEAMFSRLWLNKEEISKSEQIILLDTMLAQIHDIVKAEKDFKIYLSTVIKAIEIVTKKYLKNSFPKDKVYFSDDIAILPGDGEVLFIGDPRSNWNIESKNIIEEGFRPLYLHRYELDTPQTKIKIENFIHIQRQNKDNIIDARVKHARYLIQKAHNQVGQFDQVGMFEYLSGSSYDSSIRMDNLKKYLENLYQIRHHVMTSKNIIEAAQKLVKQKGDKINSESKKSILSALNDLSQKAYSQTLINYFANRPNFVILVYPDHTSLPTLFGLTNLGEANHAWNMISISGTHRFNIAQSVLSLASYPFYIDKINNAEAPIMYGGYAYYDYSFNVDLKAYNFLQNYEHPIAEHALQKIESLLVEELSDLACALFGGEGVNGEKIHNKIKTPKNIGFLSFDEKNQFEAELKKLSKQSFRLNDIVNKLMAHEALSEAENEIWDNLRNKLIEHEKSVTFYPRHIVSEVDLLNFSHIEIGDKIPTHKNSSWAGVTLEVVEIKKISENKAILHLIAPPLQNDHQLHQLILSDVLFQIYKALNPGPHYADKVNWKPIETLGRLRGILDNYPLAKDLLSEIIPYLELIDKNLKSAIQQQFFNGIETASAFSVNGLVRATTNSHQNTFDYGQWDGTLTYDKFTGKPIFTYRIYQDNLEVGSAEFYGQPLLCRSENGESHNLIKTTGVLNNFHITDKMSIEEICHSLPPTLFERVVVSAGNAAIHGGLRGASNVVGFALESSGVSNNKSYYLTQFSYYGSYFAWKAGAYSANTQEYNNPNQILNALYSAAVETGQILLINTTLSLTQKLLEKTNLPRLCSSLISFGVFGYHAANTGLLEAAAAITSGAATELATTEIGSYIVSKLSNK